MTSVASSLVKGGVKLVQQLDRPYLSPEAQQRNVLQRLMKKAEYTAFGKRYGFSQMLMHPDPLYAFQQEVPLHDYDKIFDEWWHRSLAGEPDVAWKGFVRHFALSSGTAGAASKYIPVTPDMTASMRQAALRMFSCLPKYDIPAHLYIKDWLMIGGSATLQNLGHCYAGDLSGINASRPPIWIRRFYKPGTAIARIPNWDERTKAIVANAPKWDVSIISGIPSWVQLTLESIIDRYKLNNIHELWPNLSVFVSGGTAFEPYRRSFERLLEKPLIYQDSYLASEGFVAFQARPETHAMRLQLNNGLFFEFVPFNELNFDADGCLRNNAETLTIDEVEEGVDYALLLTTCAGAWRYLIGDTVRFVDKDLSEIVITGRTKHFLSLCGEHLSVDNMNHAVSEVSEEMGINIREFTVSGVKSGSHFAHHWYLGVDQPADNKALVAALDNKLKALNDDYRAERSAMLDQLQITTVPSHFFYDWQRIHGKMNGQSKVPRVMNAAQFEKWIRFVADQQAAL